MSTIEIKKNLHRLIDQIDDDVVLQAYMTLLSREVTQQRDFWDELPAEHQASIDRGLADVEAGRKKPFSELMKKYQ
ncbi:hypothetical protein HNV11_04875 [Spirosoma taeanense]|uniref:Addiction module component n=1 Tax=Spirosoma taeanense TaxID=2735870 RepID=A0A6M5Y6D1_9BACT|nr:hypothetical protein [Spirosoma taeanense]QJW88761.1 hypothetical protein HNV11_04875 [Spirosoma taeanense]